jgi:hypothetical protein
MMGENRSIFRAEAVRRYVGQGREQTVVPRLVPSRAFLGLWAVLGVLLVGGALALCARVPAYASGPAVVVQQSGAPEEMVLVVLVPAEHHARLAPGQKLWVHWEGTREPAGTVIRSVEPDVLGPAEVQRRFGPSVAALVSQPVAVVRASPAGLPADRPATAYLGSTARATIEVGSRRAIEMFPVVSEMFPE